MTNGSTWYRGVKITKGNTGYSARVFVIVAGPNGEQKKDPYIVGRKTIEELKMIIDDKLDWTHTEKLP